MKAWVITLLFLGVLAALAIFLIDGSDDLPLVTPGTTDQTTLEAAADTGAIERDSAPDNERESVAVEADGHPWLDHPYMLELDISFTDPLGLPSRNRRLRLGPIDEQLNESEHRSGDDGHLHVRWSSRTRRADIVLRERGGLLRRVTVQHGQPTALTLLGARSTGNQILGWGNAGRVSISFTAGSNGEFKLVQMAPTPRMATGLHPHAMFKVEATKTDGSPIHFGNDNIQLSSVFTREMVFEVFKPTKDEPAAPPPPKPRIAGTVFGANGKPAAEVHVALLGSGPRPLARTETDEHGAFVFDDVATGEFAVRAGGGPEGLATAPAVTTTGTTPVTLNLTRGSTVSGRALDAGGQPLAKARVTWCASNDSYCDETTTDDEGVFVFANLPGTPGTVTVRDPRNKRPFPIAWLAGVLCDSHDLELRADVGDGELQLEPVLPEGATGVPMIRVWHTALGRGTSMPQPQDGASWRLGGLGAGWYQVEVLHQATGRIDAGRHWVDGKSACKLGRVTLPSPSLVTFDESALPTEAAEGELELYRLRPDFDIRIGDGISRQTLEANPTMPLPAGDYAVFWPEADDKQHCERFTARAGKSITIPSRR